MKKTKIYNWLVAVVSLSLVCGCEKDSPSVDSQTDNMINQIDNSLRVSSETSAIKPARQLRYELASVPQRDPDDFQDMVPPLRDPQECELACGYYAGQAPVLDGLANDPIWLNLPEYETLDNSSQRPITIKTCRDSENIYFLVRFPDKSASLSHKTLIWDEREQIYIEGMDREDVLVIKWSMTGGNMSYKPSLLEPHTADVWFWKACRSDPSGYLDDKYNIVSAEPVSDSLELQSDKHGKLYMQRKGDEGRSSCDDEMFFENYGPALKKFYPREPQGSRADIKGKGNWSEGYWTIEIVRKLDTGNSDDLAFSEGKRHVFGIGLYEMAGTGVEKSWHQPLYRTGDVFDTLVLVLQPKP
jgi:hypothetical protein